MVITLRETERSRTVREVGKRHSCATQRGRGSTQRDGVREADPAAGCQAQGLDIRTTKGRDMIILGLILLIIGLIVGALKVLIVIGAILLVIGIILALAGAAGRQVGGRRHWF